MRYDGGVFEDIDYRWLHFADHWSLVLLQLLIHMHAQLTTWIGLCLSPIHSLVLALRRTDLMWHPKLVLVVQLTQTHSPRQMRTVVQ